MIKLMDLLEDFPKKKKKNGEESQDSGPKKIKTPSGKHHLQVNYNGSPGWFAGMQPFDFSASLVKRLGRKGWDFKYENLNEGDLFPDVFSTNEQGKAYLEDPSNYATWTEFSTGETYWYDTEGTISIDGLTTSNSLLYSNNLFSRLIEGTYGGTLPFIFQLNSHIFLSDQFSITKIQDKSFEFLQTSKGYYNVGFKLKEVW